MDNRPDLLVIGPDGTPKLVVEVKAKSGTSTRWAAQFRRNLVAHGLVPTASYFLLASPEQFYLWKPKHDGFDAPPDFVADSRQMLAPWLDRMHTQKGTIGESALELLIHAWLSEVMTNPNLEDIPDWLQKSGLHSAIRGARLRSNASH